MAKDPYRYFRIEANELLDQLAKGVLDLEKGNVNTELVMRLLRLAHTLKGAARVVKQVDIADLAHALEDTLLPYRDTTKMLPHDHVDKALVTIDAIAKKMTLLPRPDSAESTEAPIATPSSSSLSTAEPIRVVRADLVEVDTLLEGLGEIGNELGGMGNTIGVIGRIRNLTEQITAQRSISFEKLKSTTEEIHSLLGSAEHAMSAGLARIDRELRDACDAAERLRLVPISSIFNTLERTARDAAHITGKQVEFQAIGGDVRIDGAILDSVQSALIQLVRNAVAHGIEEPAQRNTSKKSTSGKIVLTVERRGYRAWFRCQDDGTGIDIDAVRRTLQKKGMSVSDTEKLNAESVIALLLKGGISTTNVATEISGRGIGLDLVREAMQKLNGEIIAKTQAGLGTSIELSVPLSLAALDVLVVESLGHIAALPLDAVRCTLRITPEEIIHTPHGKVIVFEDNQIPYMPLQIGVAPKTKRASISSPAVTVVIMSTSDKKGSAAAVAIERLVGMDTIILRALPSSCPVDPIVLGVHLDGEGNPRMVIDPDVLATRRWFGEAEFANIGRAKKAMLPILIIDDSLTTRMLESSILTAAGYNVELATNAEEGLEMARRSRYALFLVDVEMPGMTGFDFVKQTKTDPVLRHIPSILVTSCNSPEDRQRGVDSGASGYIVKGEFDQVHFLNRIAELIETQTNETELIGAS